MKVAKYLNSNKIKLVLIIFIVTTICFLVYYHQYLSCRNYSCLKFPEKKLWQLKEVYEDTSKTWRGLLSHPNYTIKLEKLSKVTKQEAEELTKINTMKIEKMFDNAISPYPGMISDTITCEKTNKPIINNTVSDRGVKIIYIRVYANDRYQYGICLENQIAYETHIALFYCPNKKNWYNIELFIPINSGNLQQEEVKQLFLTIDC